ncbi:hypothetical protein Pcac1_g22670 [Phytophthora cactorum]|uniref:Uncharacterized protein n=2 Tax=Phytophthora cactorum TaxID=29920 RepID=A0A8T1CHZ7_9STRA|nr:hypothetical protein Pcac1_g22670 [Phytophthora cactorum]KAG2844124.1 hypothetical protein PC112_g2322 [Phytophthora cactorum]KAG2921520.1 hypothetical protein PC115_g9486 [Phytophthora cactorum]KAG2930048.1 hypothetical protein PC114_g2543 [Phytophthora cactorum]KAG3014725.1 hypothetical protein PC120_g12525 [Phytophthora cactorum]
MYPSVGKLDDVDLSSVSKPFKNIGSNDVSVAVNKRVPFIFRCLAHTQCTSRRWRLCHCNFQSSVDVIDAGEKIEVQRSRPLPLSWILFGLEKISPTAMMTSDRSSY